MKNKMIINDKEYKNITITDKSGEVLVVIQGDGSIIYSTDYKVLFDVGEDELLADKPIDTAKYDQEDM